MQNFLLDTILAFVKAGLDFVLCGGIACILQGCERTTFDLDLNLGMTDENLKRFMDLCKSMKLHPRIPEPIEVILNSDTRQRWIEEKGALVYTVLSDDGMVQVDVFLNYPIPFNELKKNADSFEIDGYKFHVSSKKDLIEAKKQIEPLREKDQQDIRQREVLIANAKTAEN